MFPSCSVCIVSVLRLVTLIEVQTSRDMDATYSSAQIVYWSTAEVNASIICACTMTLKPLIQKWFPSMLSTSHYGRERSLRWITPIVNSHRESRQPTTRPPTNHRRTDSDTAKAKNETLPRVEEKEHAANEESLKYVDLEAQISGGSTEDDPSIVGMSPLSAPPKAHLRLSIHVTKSVQVSRYPESPMSGESFENKEEKQRRSNQEEDYVTPPYTPGWQSEGSTVLICKDFSDEPGLSK
jgi:hypothetical protein